MRISATVTVTFSCVTLLLLCNCINAFGQSANPPVISSPTSSPLSMPNATTKFSLSQSADTDGDGISDEVELSFGLDPNDPADVWIDTDADRLPLIVEKLESRDETIKDNDVFANQRLLVQQAYVDIQHRFADGSEITPWIERLSAGTSLPADVYSALLDETELARFGFIGRVYLSIMRRNADVGGARAHLNGLQNGVSKQAVIDTFVQSNEFVSRYGSLSNSEFVNLVYQNVLGREADEGGLANWLGLLDSGQISQAGMMLGFIDSLEYINSQDNAQRVGILNLFLTGQSLSVANSAKYQQLLQGDGALNSVLRAILASDGYRQSLMATISRANDDTDSDGIPDGVEFVDGTNVNLKDNDISADDRLYVKQMLRDLTGEIWSPQTVTVQVAALSLAGSRAAWVESLLALSQFKDQRQAISRLYFAFFLRAADHGGLMNWIGHHEAGMSLTQIADIFVGSEEFQVRYGNLSDDEFIRLVYRNVLKREADSVGFDNWKDHLTSGRLSRGAMMVEFSESVENKANSIHRDKVTLLVSLLLKRQASASEFDYWHQQLSNDVAVAELIIEIMSRDAYLARFYDIVIVPGNAMPIAYAGADQIVKE